jgi:peptide/nickel transport system substrate-binding protein
MIDLADLLNKFLIKTKKAFSPNTKVGNFLGKSARFMKFIVIPKFRSLLPFKYNEEQKLLFSLSKNKVPSIRQIKQLKYFLDYKEKRVIFISSVFLVLALFVLGGRFLWNNLVEVPKYGGEYTEGLVGSIQYINPILCQANDTDRDISRLVFSGLFKINTSGELENDLIKKYQISEDQKTYIFTLKDNIFWHDGVQLIADDIGFTLAAIQNPEFKSPLYKTLQGVVFEKISEESFKLSLAEPFSPFISTLTFGILPMHLWENISPENATLTELNKKPIGTGPFMYKSFKKDSSGYVKQYTLVNFKEYYGKRAYLKSIVLKLYTSPDSALEALKNNQVQGISFLSQDSYKEINTSENFDIYNFNMPQYSALFFNPKKQELLKDRDLRRALSLAINKKELAAELGSGLKEAYGPLDFIIDPEQDEYSLEDAAELLKGAGWEMKDNFLEKDEKKLELTITSVDNNEYIRILQYIKKQWSKLGITTNLEIIPGQKITSQVITPRDYEILLIAQILSYDPDPYPFWHSSQTKVGLNLSNFANQNIDDILEEARKITSFEERLIKYDNFQEILKKEYVAIFLFRPTYHYPVDNHVRGVDTEVIYLPSDRFSNIENWYLKTKKTFKK